MKFLKVLIVAPVLAVFLLVAAPVPAYADPDDDVALEKVDTQIAYLWEVAESSGGIENNDFFPAFAKELKGARQTLLAIHADLARTTETGRSKDAVETLRSDIKQMEKDLAVWQAASEDEDVKAFEQASADLSDTVADFGFHLEEYEQVAYTEKAIKDILLHSLPVTIAFAISALCFARAVLNNNRDIDVQQEITRKLRWHAFVGSLLVTAALVMPFYVYMFTDYAVVWWHWMLVVPGVAVWVVVLVRRLQLRRLARQS